MLITPEYQKLNEELHESNKHYGTSGHKWAKDVLGLCGPKCFDTQDVLDYGCGKSTLALNLPFDIKQYDPAIPKYAERPEPADLVVCTDVLEHVEYECLDEVLNDIYSLCKKGVFLMIHNGPAKKTLEDGRNAHIIQEEEGFWLGAICARFRLLQFGASGVSTGKDDCVEYVFVGKPRLDFARFCEAQKESENGQKV